MMTEFSFLGKLSFQIAHHVPTCHLPTFFYPFKCSVCFKSARNKLLLYLL